MRRCNEETPRFGNEVTPDMTCTNGPQLGKTSSISVSPPEHCIHKHTNFLGVTFQWGGTWKVIVWHMQARLLIPYWIHVNTSHALNPGQ